MTRCLAIDVGNTSTKVGLFEQEDLIYSNRVDHSGLNWPQFQTLKRRLQFDYAMISSTKHLSAALLRRVKDDPRILILNHLTKLPFANNYRTPKTLGADRLAGIAGSLHFFPEGNNLVIDAGTCITYDFVTKGKIYVGGNISPGISIRLKGMNRYTDVLPMIDRFTDATAHGTTTISAMKAGAAWGAVHEVHGFITQYQKQFGKVNILLTGGDASFFGKRLKTKIFASPNLLLHGLRKLLAINVKG